MSIDNEQIQAHTSVDAVMQDWFGERDLKGFEKGQVLFFELAGYDSRYDEDGAGWNSASQLLATTLDSLGYRCPIEVSCSTMDSPVLLEDPEDIGGQLLNKCCLMLPVEEDEDGESRISLSRKEGDITIDVELTGSFQTVDSYDAEGECSDSSVEIKVDPIIRFSLEERVKDGEL